MKSALKILTGLLIISVISTTISAHQADSEEHNQRPVTVVYSPDLKLVVAQWTDMYNQLYPGALTNLTELTSPDDTGVLENEDRVGIISCKWLREMDQGTVDKMIIGRDVVVPVISSSNSYKDKLYKKGVRPDDLSLLLTSGGTQYWSLLLEGAGDVPLHVYNVGNNGVDGILERFSREKINPGALTTLAGRDELVSTLRNDPNAIGFCRLSDIIDYSTFTFKEGIEVLPIDKNGSGELDYFENIYANPEVLVRGIWIGKYPQEMIEGLYAVTGKNSASPASVAFMKWLLQDGQTALKDFGYSDLTSSEIRSKMDKLTEQKAIIEPVVSRYAGLKIVIMLLIVAIAAGIIVETVIIFRRYRNAESVKESPEYSAAFNVNTIHIPRGLFFDKTHTWAFMQSDGKVRIGLDDFLPRVTGHLTGLKMKNPGESIKKGEVIMTLVQKGKQLNIKAPVSGVILEQNKKLLHDTSMIHYDPYTGGWVYMIEPTNWLREIQLLFMAEKFRNWLGSEFARLKDFFALATQAEKKLYPQAVFQEGGELIEGVLMEMGPEVWEDFQSQFIEKTT
jgi:glycine cleavage system H lipoate-binding protein/ABC-type phosphate transport system substrate-binding protein